MRNVIVDSSGNTELIIWDQQMQDSCWSA